MLWSLPPACYHCRADNAALLQTLVSCFSNHTTAQLFEKFEALTDYLNLPRCVGAVLCLQKSFLVQAVSGVRVQGRIVLSDWLDGQT